MRKHVALAALPFFVFAAGVFAPLVFADSMNGSDILASQPAAQPTGGFTPLVTIPGLNDASDLTTTAGVATFLNNIYKFSIGIAVFLAVAMIIWGGVEYALSEAITSKSDGRKKIQQALLGLLLVLSPYLVFTIINPAILNLNVNFPALSTTWGTYVPGGDFQALSGADGTDEHGNSYYMCSATNSSSDCKSAFDACAKAGGSYGGNDSSKYYLGYDVVCIDNNGGNVGPRQDSTLNPLSNYTCTSGQKIAVKCTKCTNGTGGTGLCK